MPKSIDEDTPAHSEYAPGYRPLNRSFATKRSQGVRSPLHTGHVSIGSQTALSICARPTLPACHADLHTIILTKRHQGIDEKFFRALNERWPKLTTTQKQLCGMIRAGLQTTEIANLLDIARNAVRKKMNLGEEGLDEAIAAIR